MQQPLFDGTTWQTFDVLTRPDIKHGFSWRSAVPREQLERTVPEFLRRGGFPAERAIYCEQPHSNKVAWVNAIPEKSVPGADAVATQLRNTPLLVRVADCGPVYFFDPVNKAIALAHSGRKGTELNITSRVIETLRARCGTNPADLIVELGPCIRPPYYEIDFAAEILRQARACGVQQIHDCGLCTAADLQRYYSYRAEKGQTGRMWAVLMLT
jgi:YfiH family protein